MTVVDGRARSGSAGDRLDRVLAAALEGDDRAVEELVRRTQPTIWRVSRALGSVDETDDLVQETYLRALRSLAGFRGEAPVTAWLVAIARRVCADDVRRRQRRRRLDQRLRTDRPGGTSTTPQIEVVDDLVAALAEDRRDAFVLTQLVGLSYEEAAEVLGCPIGTVRSRVARARGDLIGSLRRADAG